jgi:hypothetical protein
LALFGNLFGAAAVRATASFWIHLVRVHGIPPLVDAPGKHPPCHNSTHNESGSSSSSSSPTDVHVSTPMAAAVASFNALEPVHDRAEALLHAGELLRLCVGVSVNVNVNVSAPSPEHDSNNGDSADAVLVQRHANTNESEEEYVVFGSKWIRVQRVLRRDTTFVTRRDLRG